MSTTHQISASVDKMPESFRDKVIRKCGESVEMKEKFFTKYAESLETVVFSTSGKSPNLIYALQAAREKQILTVAFSGKDGGRFPEIADYCFIVPSYSIHRIQEVHATVVHVVWDLVHMALGAEDVT